MLTSREQECRRMVCRHWKRHLLVTCRLDMFRDSLLSLLNTTDKDVRGDRK